MWSLMPCRRARSGARRVIGVAARNSDHSSRSKARYRPSAGVPRTFDGGAPGVLDTEASVTAATLDADGVGSPGRSTAGVGWPLGVASLAVAARSSRKSATGAPSAHRKQLGAWYTPDDLVATIVDNVVTDEFLDGCRGEARNVEGARPGMRGREVPGRGRCSGGAARHRVRTARHRHRSEGDRRRPPERARRAGRVHRRPPSRLRWRPVRSRDRQPAIPVTDGGSDDPRRGERAQRRTRTQTPRSSSWRWPASSSNPTVGVSHSSSRSRSSALAMPARCGPSFDERSTLFWSSWTGERVFDAQVHTCVLAFQFGPDNPRLRRDSGDPVRPDRDANVDGGAGGSRAAGTRELVVRGDGSPGHPGTAGARDGWPDRRSGDAERQLPGRVLRDDPRGRRSRRRSAR